jgi:type III restriction enzyme
VDRNEYYKSVHPQTIAFEMAREITRHLTDARQSGREQFRQQGRAALFPQVLVIAQQYLATRVDYHGCNPSEVGLQTYAERITGLLAAAIVPDDTKGEAPLLPRLNRYQPAGTTAKVHFKTVKPVQTTHASHLNFVACDTESWEQAAMFQLESLASDGAIQCYARNDHLEFTIPYELFGQNHAYEPDFLVRMASGKTLIVEIKGRERPDTEAKHQAARRWVTAVNNWGRLGRWDFLPCRDPQQLAAEITAGDAV